jgi:hypothetical protein
MFATPVEQCTLTLQDAFLKMGALVGVSQFSVGVIGQMDLDLLAFYYVRPSLGSYIYACMFIRDISRRAR